MRGLSAAFLAFQAPGIQAGRGRARALTKAMAKTTTTTV